MNENHVERAKHADRNNRAVDAADSAGSDGEQQPETASRLSEIARSLDRLRHVPPGLLVRLVAERGACMETLPAGDPPGWLFDAGSDKEVAARLCAGCPVQRECLELELRFYGPDTVGVWGALGEDDRRALYPLWAARRDDTDGSSGAGRDGSVGGGR